MANDPNVGVGSTATTETPPDVARYEELKASQATSVGVGSTATSVGVGSTATTETEPDTSVDGGQSDPSRTTETEPDTSVDGGQSAPDSGNVGVGSTSGNVGVGST